MKTPIFVLLLAVLFVTVFSSDGYTELTSAEISSTPLIQDLQKLGADYVTVQGIFYQQPRLPNGYWKVAMVDSISKKTTSDVTTYKFVVQILCESRPKLIRAIYEISFAPTTGDTNINSFSYEIIPNTFPPRILSDAPSFVDTKSISQERSDFKSLLDQAVEYTVKDAVEKGLFMNSSYTVTRIFWAKGLGFTRTPGYTYSVLLTSSEGFNYRVELTSYNNQYNLGAPMNPRYKIYQN